MSEHPKPSRLVWQNDDLTVLVRALTSCTQASNGIHAYRDGICRCGALKRNADGSVPTQGESK